MEEKKMTNEDIAKEIVKALVNTKKTLEDLHEDDDDYDKLSLLKKINNSSLWLIHLLQGENEQLHTLTNLQESNVNTMHEKNMELRNEIERLTEENGYLDMVAKQALADYQKCEIANTELQELNAKYYNEAKDLRRENAELQKQVDELKANQVIECHGMLKGCDMVKQAVKDTAKEILQRIINIIKKSDGFLAEEVIRIMAKQKGVEVE